MGEGTTVCEERMAPGSPASPAPPEVGEGEAEASSDSEGEGDLGSVGEERDPRKVVDSLLGEGRDGEDWCELGGDARQLTSEKSENAHSVVVGVEERERVEKRREEERE
jgi:hypothetical protein